MTFRLSGISLDLGYQNASKMHSRYYSSDIFVYHKHMCSVLMLAKSLHEMVTNMIFRFTISCSEL